MKPHIQLAKERARRILAESILFRTSVVQKIHEEIWNDVWQGQEDSNAQRLLSPRDLTRHRLSFD
jgi:hypothetical protein